MRHTLEITFHNPNSSDQLMDLLITLSAQVAKEKVQQTLRCLSQPEPKNELA